MEGHGCMYAMSTRPSGGSFPKFFSMRIIGSGMLWLIAYEIIHRKHIFGENI